MFWRFPQALRRRFPTHAHSATDDRSECSKRAVSYKRLLPSKERILHIKDATGQCPLCPTLHLIHYGACVTEVPKNESALFWRLFYEPCRKCQAHRKSISHTLCSFCKHLSLMHLIDCVFPKFGELIHEKPTDVTIKLRTTISELTEDSQCVCCRFFGRIIVRNGKYYVKDDPDVERARVRTIIDDGHVLLNLRVGRIEPTLSMGLISTKFAGCIENFAEIEVLRLPRKKSETSTRYNPREWVNWDFVKAYLKLCEKRRITFTQGQTMPDGFMLIDVWKMCLVDPAPGSRYAALSYVWGPGKSNEGGMTTKEHLPSFQSEGRFAKSDIPATIRDALIVCRELHVPYLWVDRYCITQDADTKHDQIQQMGHIYGSSTFTIIAASGNDPSHGLPGVSSRKRKALQELVLGGFKFTEKFPSPRVILPTCAWSKRGWTFQEAALSQVIVAFTDDGMWVESSRLKGSRLVDEAGKEDDPLLQYNYGYADAVSEYTQRKFSYESDIVEAFSGYLTRISGTNHLFGLPLDDIDRAVLWQSDSHANSRASVSERFPTWSWTSVLGKISYEKLTTSGNDAIHRKAFYVPIATWDIFKPEGERLFQPIGLSPFSMRQWGYAMGPYLFDLVTAWRERCFPGKIPLEITGPKTWHEVRDFFQSRWPTYESFWLESRGLLGDVSCRLSKAEIGAASNPGRLVVHSQISRYFLQRCHSTTKKGFSEPFRLVDQNGDTAGIIHLSNPHAKVVKQALGRSSIFSTFIAIALRETELLCDVKDIKRYSSTTNTNWEAFLGPLSVDQSNIDRFIHDMGYDDTLGTSTGRNPPPVLAVMMVWKHGNVWHRMGIGHVFLKIWVRSRPWFRSIVLE